MSQENKKGAGLASNEDVIAELTKDLKTSLVTVDDDPGKFVINPGPSHDNLPTNSGDGKKSVSDIPQTNPNFDVHLDKDYMEFDKDEEDKEDNTEKEEPDSESDEIDEVTLKDAEMDLTDDEKADRKVTAEVLKAQGNDAFKQAEFEKSIEKYTEGLRICPLQFSQQRSVLYCNRSAAKMKLEKYDKAVKDCTKAIELDDKYLKAYLRRAQSYEARDKLDEALADFKKILELDPSHADSRRAAVRLPPLIEEKQEKLKTEMLGKLKDLGNMILKPFGLSTENFKLEQDPESKGYKINFQQ